MPAEPVIFKERLPCPVTLPPIPPVASCARALTSTPLTVRESENLSVFRSRVRLFDALPP